MQLSRLISVVMTSAPKYFEPRCVGFGDTHFYEGINDGRVLWGSSPFEGQELKKMNSTISVLEREILKWSSTLLSSNLIDRFPS